MYKQICEHIHTNTDAYTEAKQIYIYTNSISMYFVGFTSLLLRFSLSSFFFLHLFFSVFFFSLILSPCLFFLFLFFLFDLSFPCFDFLSLVFLAFFFFHTFFKHFTLTFSISPFPFSLPPRLSSINLFFLPFSFCFLAQCLF